MAAHRPTVVIPVDTHVREFDAKLLLSCVAAERGFPVVLGSRSAVHLNATKLPRGFYLSKDVRKGSLRIMRILRALGHEIVAWEEEGLVRKPDPYYYHHRVSTKALDEIVGFCTWGRDDADLMQRYPGYNGTPLHVTGNPRIDLIRPAVRGLFDADVEEIRARFGNFVLINTNFGFANHYVPELRRADRVSSSTAEDDSVQGYDAGFMRHKAVLFEAFKRVVPELARALPDANIVIRPHPSESVEAWSRIAAECTNVHVVREGAVTPWLAACRALVHNGCTTAIEAFVLRTPAISFEPATSERFDVELPRALSHRAATTEDLTAILGEVLSGARGACDDPQHWQTAGHHLAALDGDLASERIADVLESRAAVRGSNNVSLTTRILGMAAAHLRTAEFRLVRSKQAATTSSADYQRLKVPDMSVEDVRTRLRQLASATGRFDGVDVAQSDKNIFKIAASRGRGAAAAGGRQQG